MKQKKPLKLTKKLAQELIFREMGVSVKNLEKIEGRSGVYGFDQFFTLAYEARMGALCVRVENDLHEHIDRYVLEISDSMGNGTIRFYFYPDTLNRDTVSEKIYLDDVLKENMKHWVGNRTKDFCHRMVDEYAQI